MTRELREGFIKGLENYRGDRQMVVEELIDLEMGNEHWDLAGFWGAGPTGHYRVVYED